MSTLMPTLSINNDPRCTQFKQQGFTLLELVLVMLIIGLIASTPLAFIDNQDNQLRYDETVAKMKLIKRAVYNQSTYQNQPLLSGFVVDNGVLPPTSGTSSQDASELFPLIAKQDINGDPSIVSNWKDKRMISPYITIVTGAPDEQSDYKQLKGYQGGYLSDGLDSNREFRDGWGLGFEVGSTASGSYYFAFKGDDGAHPSPYNIVVSGAVESLDWQVPLNQLDITLINNGNEIKTVAVTVFQNKEAMADDERWLTYHFEAAASLATHSLSLAAGKWHKNGISVTNPESTYIPAGQHPVFVLDSVGSPEKYNRLLVIPRSTQPSLQFEVD
ncbi:type II secretion system protein [Neptuniibacter pectenicola]|jgi:prepilin-type N-terminal cleavage/methylation domain-containing protein|uniref:type II secretion system protein n=1 Tax=Neptuniibacter pectenicola TaxID=1806669 RepID=UPI003F4B84C5